ncbi:hypothetical protein K435DRAFT_683551, partial [Dendrothele bispora CBS 962.96]
AFQLHLRLLVGLHSQSEVPKDPPQSAIDSFNARFNQPLENYPKIAVVPEIPAGHSALRERVVSLRRDLPNTRSTISKNIGKIDESIIEMILATLDHNHFDAWCPNLADNPRSVYNVVHQAVAIETFKHAAVGYGYSFIGAVDLKAAQDNKTLAALYDNYVWSYWKRSYDRDKRKPGAHADRVKYNKAIQRRSDVRLFYIFMYIF